MTIKFVSTPDGFIAPSRIVRIETETTDLDGLFTVFYIDEHGQGKSTQGCVLEHDSFELP